MTRTRLLDISAIAGTTTALVVALAVPAEQTQGHLSKMLFVHVPSIYLAYVAFAVTLVGSAAYLITRNLKWDRLAGASGEVGVFFTGLAILLGMVWAKPTWGVWWTWEPRLTTTAVMLMIYIGYLAVRSFADDPDKRARWSAIVGVVGFIDVPIVYLSVYWWRTLHQPPSSPRSVAPEILFALLLNLLAFTVVYVYLLGRRYRLAVNEQELERIVAHQTKQISHD